MSTGSALSVAAVFTWLGMVVAISFLEAPLKFRAPGVTLPVGLGIGRLVFRALNACELALSALIVVAVVVAAPPVAAGVAVAVPIGALLIQVLALRPVLTRRSDAVLSGADGPRSQAHYWYVALEVVKVVALLAAGALLLTGGG
jgi:hypothetical protein